MIRITAALLLLTPLAITSLRADTLSAMPGIQNVNIIESTGTATTRTLTLFAMFRWPNLSIGTRDFSTSAGELYDLYFSDADGTPNYNGGEYLSITATYSGPGAGLNIGRVWISFNNGHPDLYANIVSSFNPGATDYVAGSEAFAVDGSNATFTQMGKNAPGDRMRVTVGFPSNVTPVPEPATGIMILTAAALLARLKRNKQAIY